MKKEPTTMSGRKKTQLNMSPRASFVYKEMFQHIEAAAANSAVPKWSGSTFIISRNYSDV